MSAADQLVGVPQDVIQDSRVQEAIAKIDAADDKNAAPIISATPPDLSKYGIKLRTAGLMQQTMLVRIIGSLKKHGLAVENNATVSFHMPDEYQPFLWTFLLGAPLKDVYRALDVLDKEGLPDTMVLVHEWFDSIQVPTGASVDILEAMTNSFSLAMKAMQFVPQSGGNEKKVTTGS